MLKEIPFLVSTSTFLDQFYSYAATAWENFAYLLSDLSLCLIAEHSMEQKKTFQCDGILEIRRSLLKF